MTFARASIGAASLALLAAIGLQLARPAAAREPERAPDRLALTGLYDPARPGAIAAANRPFSPQYPLWSDGLTKRRWVYLPEGRVIDARDPGSWDFPAGTRFWKEFSQGDRKVETRFLWKTDGGDWIFATYLWNDDGTDAVLAPEDGAVTSVPVKPGRTHTVPAATDCTACHGESSPRPLGFNALQLSPDRDPLAIHGDRLSADMVTLATLLEERRLVAGENFDPAPRIRTADPATRSVLGYLAANCGACHDGRGGISAAAPVLRLGDLLEDGDAVARTFIDRPTRWQIPGQPDGSTVLVRPGAPELSALLARLRSRAPSSQMPPLGTIVRDDAAVEAIEAWIRQMPATAPVTVPLRGRSEDPKIRSSERGIFRGGVTAIDANPGDTHLSRIASLGESKNR
jgi:cytochrome c553